MDDVWEDVARSTDNARRQAAKQASTTTTTPPVNTRRQAGKDYYSCKLYTRNQNATQGLDNDDPDWIHASKCEVKGCPQCLWARNKKTWISKYLLDASDPSKGTWLMAGTNESTGMFSVGCCACKLASAQTPYARLGVSGTSMQNCNFLKHEKSPAHAAALIELGFGDAPDDVPQNAPPREHWNILLKDARAGRACGDTGIARVGGRKKIRKMLFCLAEGAREQHREALRKAQVISLHQDVGQGRLAVRYCCTDSRLQQRWGLLGAMRLLDPKYEEFMQRPTHDANALRDATLYIISTLSTPMASPPYFYNDVGHDDAVMDTDLCQNILNSTELLDTDAAADEVLAGRKLRGWTPTGNKHASPYDGAMPNVKVQNLDKPHGSRRISSRTWKCDPFLMDVANVFVIQKKSVANIIENSDIFSDLFARNCAKLQSNPTECKNIRNVMSRKHRFDSHSKPFGRLTIFMGAAIKTMQTILDTRGRSDGGAGEASYAFMNWLSTERCIQLAMLADGGDENLRLTRFLDDESFDKSVMSGEVSDFLRNIHWLFCDRGCAHVGSYTEHMIKVLKSQVVVYIDKLPKTFGGKREIDDALPRCYNRMENWVRLATMTVRAEFPGFEFMQAFTVFRLQRRGERQDTYEEHLGSRWSDGVQRLAQFLDLDASQLESEILDYKPKAQHVFQTENVTTACAWQRAVATRTYSPTAVLKEALMRFIAYGASTSGVESVFKTSKTSGAIHRTKASDDLVNDDLQIRLDVDQRSDVHIVDAATNVWAKVYGGTPRASGSDRRRPRRDKGKPRTAKAKATKGKPSMAKWISRRRAAVDHHARASGKTGDTYVRMTLRSSAHVGANGWTAAHQKEEAFQRNKRVCRRLDAARENSLLPSEVTPELLEAVRLKVEADDKRLKEYDARKAKGFIASQPMTLEGASVFVTSAALAAAPSVPAAIVAAKASRTTDMLKATAFVVEDLSDVKKPIAWCAMLGGLTICNVDFITKKTRTWISFSSCMATRRLVHVSDKFFAAHPLLGRILLTKIAAQSTKVWSYEGNAGTAKAKAVAGKAPLVLAFLAEDELVAPDWGGGHNATFSSSAFLSFSTSSLLLLFSFFSSSGGGGGWRKEEDEEEEGGRRRQEAGWGSQEAGGGSRREEHDDQRGWQQEGGAGGRSTPTSTLP